MGAGLHLRAAKAREKGFSIDWHILGLELFSCP
jgi:hypothetical protein